MNVSSIRILPAVEWCEINDIPEIVAFATLQESRQGETDQRRTPGKQTVFHVSWRVVATRQRRHGGIQVVAHRRQPADHRYSEILETQTERNAKLRILKIKWRNIVFDVCKSPLSPSSE